MADGSVAKGSVPSTGSSVATTAARDAGRCLTAVTMHATTECAECHKLHSNPAIVPKSCTPCHSELGDGRGMIVQRGFPPPPSYHIERLRQAPVQHFYDVITNGYGAMYSFAERVQPADRWAIAAYIRALQRSQNASVADVPPDQKGVLQ